MRSSPQSTDAHRPARAKACAGNARPEATPCRSAQNPFGLGVGSNQRDTPRAATGEEACGPGLDESEAKIGYRALSHKDARRSRADRVTARVLRVTDRW